jgi:hypothetical protein
MTCGPAPKPRGLTKLHFQVEVGPDERLVEAVQCMETIEKRFEGQRFVFSRHQCRNWTRNLSGYCHQHNFAWRAVKARKERGLGTDSHDSR